MLASARRTRNSVFMSVWTSLVSPGTDFLSFLLELRLAAFTAALSSSGVAKFSGFGQSTSDQVNRYIHKYSPNDIRWLRRSADVKPAASVSSRLLRLSGGRSL